MQLFRYMIIKDSQPLSVVEDVGFKYLMKTASPNFKVPSRRSISRKTFENHEVMKIIVMAKLKSIQYFTLTKHIQTI